MTSVGDPLVGQVLDRRYQITSRLARGGMATVYQAVDTRLTRNVAVKLMHVGLGDDAEFARKFDREARAAARLSHPNVVSVFDQGRALLDGHTVRPYIVMEFVEGVTLRDLIVREAPMAPLRALEVFEPVLAALAAAHDAGLVHRDVKPENVLISHRGQIKVADFGLAKAVSSQTSTATQGLLIGTVSYLPPELVVSGRADARSDVYSAGVVLFELLTGRKPHTGETPIQVAYAHVHHDVPPPSSVRRSGQIPPYLDALVTGATARDAGSRPFDARVLLAQVRRVRTALLEGLADDPDLTQDLTAVQSGAAGDPADLELTQAVPAAATTYRTRTDPGPTYADPSRPRQGWPAPDPTAPATRGGAEARPSPGPTSAEPRSAGVTPGPSAYGPPTVRDAPPPAVPAHLTESRGGAATAVRPQPQVRRTAERVAAERDRQGRRRRRGLMALLLVLMLTTAAALAGWYLTEGRFTTAPALTSMSRAEAEQVGSSAGLRVVFEDAHSESVPRGAVITTDPGPGAKVRDGGEIEAVVSLGPERYPMPAVVGLSRSAAAAALQGARLDAGTVAEVWSESVPEGSVVKASQKKGASLKPGTAVDLTVSKGPEPIEIVNYTGRASAGAVRALEKSGFVVVQRTENSDTVAKGLMLSQSPASGTGKRGDTVTVTRSLGPVLVTVPNVQAMGVRAAEKVMADAGFKTKVQPAEVNYIGVGYVVSTSPGARAKAPQGSTITLIVV